MIATAIRGLRVSTLGLAIGLHAMAGAQAATYTVGAGVGCHFTSIQAALNAAAATAGHDVIRIARNQTYADQELNITGHAVTLIGGYDSCADLDPGSDQTTLRGKAPALPFVPIPPPIVAIDGGTSALTVTLRNLFFADAQGTPIAILGPMTVVLDRTFVTGNSTPLYGGGIAIDGSGTTELRLTNGSFVTSNVGGLEGGGIACHGEALVVIDGTSGVFGNSSQYGGGIALRHGCGLYSIAGQGFAGIWGNEATYGGGIFAADGSYAIVAGGASRPATVHSNTARYGGGLYLEDADTVGAALSAWIHDNDAEAAGGGVMVAAGATFQMERVLGPTCHDPIRCSRLSGNRVLDTPGYGGALAVMPGGTALVAGTYVENNRASHGAAVTAQGSQAALRMEGVVAAGNRGSSTFHGASGAALELAHLTVTGNADPLGTHAVVAIDDATTSAALLSSIVWEPGDAIFSPAATGAGYLVDCLLAHSTATLPPGATLVATGDPRFRSAAGGDFHLANDSPAIDFCDNFQGAATKRDIDHQPRGLDTGGVDHGIAAARYDLGADESMLIFADGFETGNRARWGA